MIFDAQKIAGALRAMLPHGEIWGGPVQSRVMDGLAVPFAEVAQSAADLLIDAAPVAPVFLITEWEDTLGLPDKCIGAPGTLGERQALIRARWAAMGGQSIDYFIRVAADMGIEITITEYTEGLVVGTQGVGFSLNNGGAWAHHWTVNVLNSVAITNYVVGYSTAGDPLRRWGNPGLECEFNRLKPAQSVLSFTYLT